VGATASQGQTPNHGATPVERPPPTGDEAVIVIATGEILRGALPDRALRMVRQWASIHRDELVANWERTQVPEPPNPIAPLP
jgi:hypothetical protein